MARAEQVSSEFFTDFKQKMISRRKSNLPVLAQAGKGFLWGLPATPTCKRLSGILPLDFNRLVQAARKPHEQLGSSFVKQLQLIKRAIDRYES